MPPESMKDNWNTPITVFMGDKELKMTNNLTFELQGEKAYPHGQINWREWDAKLNGIYPSTWEKFKTIFISIGIGFMGGWLTAVLTR